MINGKSKKRRFKGRRLRIILVTGLKSADNILSALRGGQKRDACFARRTEKDEEKELQQ